jgi:hypothetical protein
VNLTQQDIDALTTELEKISEEAGAYFKRVGATFAEKLKDDPWLGYSDSVPANVVSAEDKVTVAPDLSARLRRLSVAIVEASESSPLVAEVDRAELRIALRKMLAGLSFQRYSYWAPRVMNDEDRVLGVEPASQTQENCSLRDARDEFFSGVDKLRKVLDLIFPSGMPLATAIARSETAAVKKYRPNTAFIMMWISKEHPELEDVKNCFKDVFKQFGVTAVRSDEIEHQGVITERILDEIAASEFLIADLTGERPSVYYEVGYAHAIGKRPILYRKAGTELHFDLTVHNCPEYDNLTDLRQKLQARLSILTNKHLGDESGPHNTA